MKIHGVLAKSCCGLLGMMLLIAGCGGNETQNTSSELQSANKQEASTPQEAPKPVTITVAGNASQISVDEIQRYISEPVKKKFPYITVKGFNFQKGQTLTDLVAAKQAPDIVANGAGNIAGDFIPLGLAYDMSELIKKYNFDISRIQPIYFDAIRIGSGSSGVIGIPVWNQAFGLVYNKDLFDKFAVPYPKDGMTWDQVRDLAVKLTRSDNGVQYYGLWADEVFRGANQLGLPFADWKNNKGVFQTNDWKELFTYWYSLYKIPGYPPKGTDNLKEFNEGRLAMMGGSSSNVQKLLELPDINWDVVTYPQNPKAPGAGQRVTDFDLYISNTSTNKDAAFQAITVAVSDDVQREISRNGRMSSLKNEEIQNQFGKGVPGFASKNVIAFTKPKLAIMPEYKNIPAYKIANDAFDSVLYDGKDINTALRDADEAVNQAIQAELSK